MQESIQEVGQGVRAPLQSLPEHIQGNWRLRLCERHRRGTQSNETAFGERNRTKRQQSGCVLFVFVFETRFHCLALAGLQDQAGLELKR